MSLVVTPATIAEHQRAMQTTLLDHRAVPRRASHRCSMCGALDSEGTRGPWTIRRTRMGYRRELGPWLCWTHSVQVWGRYLAARRERMELVRASRSVGYPMTRDQQDAWKARQATHGEQLELPAKHRRPRRRRRRTAA